MLLKATVRSPEKVVESPIRVDSPCLLFFRKSPSHRLPYGASSNLGTIARPESFAVSIMPSSSVTITAAWSTASTGSKKPAVERCAKASRRVV